MDFIESSIFSGIKDEDYDKLLECFSPVIKSYKSGEEICSFNDDSNFVGIVKNGMVSIVRTDINGVRTVLENICSNEIFGSIFYNSSMLLDEITVVCEKECEIMFIDYCHITKRCANACEHHSLLVQNMLSLIATRASSLGERIEVLSRRTIKEKLMSYFVLCASHSGSESFELPFSYSTLADYLCVDRSAMMRELKNMKNDGIIKTDKRRVELVHTA
ncbi:MAG: Crp/Fnr family transcriptional regulator [Acutalibacteraceae bacterium]